MKYIKNNTILKEEDESLINLSKNKFNWDNKKVLNISISNENNNNIFIHILIFKNNLINKENYLEKELDNKL